ncbi:uncharacterized protein SPAPADRAFT_67418 [Spathaspora passalidarum NRRL Y-27907]|uniref:Zn(2)-C6 fungal-type domain-containing protein n=1 Tax=Spathaspora passalidarum (strain NRRL Y-27907 / 11-Y1) TaxID=619300 RepID=G3ART4_SPAPN|nr:uncharacterized protein SPAPADRAFT_67418 [Spathaspora passalidarum NRRL Y-27907]EGW31351.1 hypothetical protein SPAPADRAFT_67418 [Spathaspora passalidarum NRRL Y-27907]
MGESIPSFEPSNILHPSGESSGEEALPVTSAMDVDGQSATHSQLISTTTGGAATEKPKRQRRSYSCGPCKLLKIKCDLQIPCSSCRKFKRINRCLLQPPQPPSQEELDKIKERKKRSNIKKLRLSNDFVQAYNTAGSMPSMITSISSAAIQLEAASEKTTISPGKRHANVQIHKTIPNIIRQFNRSEHNDQKNHHHHNQLQPQPKETSEPAISFITSQYGNKNVDISKEVNNGLASTTSTHIDLINYLLQEDHNRLLELTIVEIKRIKRLLPNKFAIFEKLFDLYMNSITEILTDLQDHNEMKRQARLVYERLLQVDDEDPKNLSKSIQFSVIEIRNLSLMFLIMANGLLFENTGLSHFLLERTAIFHPRQDIINDWIKTSKSLKMKVLSYETFTDLIYLLDWYFILKNYYAYNNMIIENYLEFNNLLNYIVLNNDFIDIIEDPSKEPTPDPEGISDPQDLAENSDQTRYPKTREFNLLAKYWIQIRWIEIEFTFFQFKGSLLVSNQLKNTLVPHRRLVAALYGNDIKEPLHKYILDIWALCYKRSKSSRTVRDIIKGYLELYSSFMGSLRPELIEFSNGFDMDNPVISNKEIELLIKNQIVLVLLIRWLSFIRVELNYFPSLRYTSYLTTMMNMFNHFNLLDDAWRRKHDSEGIIRFILDNYSVHYLKTFFQALVYQAVFLIILQDFIKDKSQRKFKIQVDQIYNVIFNQFQITLNKFLNSPTIQSRFQQVEFFKVSTNLLVDFNQYLLHQQQLILQNKESKSIDDITELLYDLKSKVSAPNWEILINFYFGSRDFFIQYIEKVWDLFEFLKIDTAQEEQETIPITSSIKLDDKLINEYMGKLTGFEYDDTIVAEYIKVCVDPHMD